MAGFMKKKPQTEELAMAQAETPEIPYVDWKKSASLRKLYFYCAIICVASATTGYDGSMLNAIQIMPTWQDQMDHPTTDRLGRLSAMYSIGSIASLPVAPFISDRFGRKMSIIIGCIIMIAAAAVQTSAHGQPQFEGGRFFMGFGNSLAQLSSPLLLTEICHPQHRGRVTAIYNCLWNVGALLNSWLSFGTQYIDSSWAWRIPTLIQALPSLIQITFIWFIPESPRWLISKDRTDEALDMLGKYHANGNVQDPTVQFEYAEIKETLRLEFLYRKTSRYIDFLKTPGNRKRLYIICSLGLISQWSGNGLLSYYTSIIYDSVGITSPNTKLGLDGGNKILSLIVSISCALLVDRVGRRPLFLSATLGMLLFFMALTITGARYSANPSDAVGILAVLWIWLHGVAYALAWSGLLVAYTVEILPFKLRAKGLTVMNVFVQIALVITNYVNPLAIGPGAPWNNSGWKLYCVYTVWIALELIWVFFMYPETRLVLPLFFLSINHMLTNLAGAPHSKRSPRSSMAILLRSAPLRARASRACPTCALALLRRHQLEEVRRRRREATSTSVRQFEFFLLRLCCVPPGLHFPGWTARITLGSCHVLL
jgi:sugar porter (SP) family MFS transporter